LGTALVHFSQEHHGYLPKAWFNDEPKSGAESWGFRDPMWGFDYVLNSRYIKNKSVFRSPTDTSELFRGEWNNGYAGLPDVPKADDIPASYRMNLSNY